MVELRLKLARKSAEAAQAFYSAGTHTSMHEQAVVEQALCRDQNVILLGTTFRVFGGLVDEVNAWWLLYR